jgi:hypothetical protein
MVAGWMVVSLCPRSSEMAAKTISGVTWAGVQEPSCGGGEIGERTKRGRQRRPPLC